MDSNTKLNVINRSSSMLVYSIPEEGIRREFLPGEMKRITFDELEKLAYQAGGRAMMENFLQIVNPDAIHELGVRTEPEYFLDDAGVVKLLKEGSLDEFLDCLDFAPIGVIELIKKYAVSLPLTDYNKRKALKEKTEFDVDEAIKHEEEDKGEIGVVAKAPERRVKPAESAPARRTAPTTAQ